MVNLVARQPDFSDLDLDFIPHPTTKDVVKKIGVDALKRSVRNLILTNFYDRPFRSYIGSGAQKLLFENASPIISNFLKDAIDEVLRNYEPRIAVRNIQVNFDIDNNGYNVVIAFSIINNNLPVVINLFLERIR
jgi:phage baseplate assembly protein W